jgi:hypothetical protein
MITVDDHLAFESARQFETVEKHVARVAVARVPVSFANVLVAIPRFVIAGIGLPCASEFDPVDLKVTRVLITVSRIIPTRVIHRALLPVARDRRLQVNEFGSGAMGARGGCRDATLDLRSQRPCVV